MRSKLRHHLEHGQSFVELGLSFVFFLFFVLGVLDLGRLFFLYVALEDSAGEAALYLALNAKCPGPPGDPVCSAVAGGCLSTCTDPNNAKARATNASDLIDMSNPGATLSYEYIPASANNEEMVKVRLVYPFQLLTPIITDIVGGDTLTLQSEASQVLLHY